MRRRKAGGQAPPGNLVSSKTKDGEPHPERTAEVVSSEDENPSPLLQPDMASAASSEEGAGGEASAEDSSDWGGESSGGSDDDETDSGPEAEGCGGLVEELRRLQSERSPGDVDGRALSSRKCDGAEEGSLQLLRTEGDGEGLSFGDILASVEGSTELGVLQKQLRALAEPRRKASEALAAAAGGGASASSKAKTKGKAEEETEALKEAAKALREGGVLETLLPEHLRQAQLRSEQFAFAQRDAQKWMPAILRNRKLPQRRFGLAASEVVATHSVSQAAAQMAPQEGFEKELLRAIEETGTEQLQLQREKALAPADPIRRRQEAQQAARLRFLLFEEQRRLQRLKRTKAKEGRRKRKQLEARQQQELLEKLRLENPELAQQLQNQLLEQHAHQRLLRQQQARRKWAKVARRFGGREIHAEINRQEQKALDERRALEKAVKGARSDDGDSNSSSSEDASEAEASGEEGPSSTAEKLAVLQGRGGRASEEALPEIPSKGLLALPFLRRGIEAQRREAEKLKEKIQRRRERRARGEEDESSSASSSSGSDSEDGQKEEEDDARDSSASESPARRRPASRRVVEAPKASAKSEASNFTSEELEAAREEVERLLKDGSWDRFHSAPKPSAAKPSEEAPAGDAPKEALHRGGEAEAAVKALSLTLEEERLKRAEAESDARAKEREDRRKLYAETSAAMRQKPEGAAREEEENPWLSRGKKKTHAKTAAASGVSADRPASGSSVQGSLDSFLRDVNMGEGAALAGEAEKEETQKAEKKEAALRPPTSEQDLLVRQAFVAGDEEEEFLREAEEEAEDEAAKKADNEDMLGWGSWAGEGVKPTRRKRTAPSSETKASSAAEAPRKKKLVVVNAQVDKKSDKYSVSELPQYLSPQEYEAALQRPVGAEWNSAVAHRRLIAPRVNVRVGAVIPPLQAAKMLEPEAREELINLWAAKGSRKRRTKVRL